MNQTKFSPDRRSLLLLALLVLIAGLVVSVVLLRHESEENQEEFSAALEGKNREIEQANMQLDSVASELRLKIAEVERLGGDKAELEAIQVSLKEQLTAVVRSRSNDAKKVRELTARLEETLDQLETQQREIEKLKGERDDMYRDNTRLKNKLVAREDSIRKLGQTQEVLDEQLRRAAVLKAEDIRISIVDSRGREREEEEPKARSIERLKVALTIADNKVARIESKELYLRIVQPDGQTLSEPSQGGGQLPLAEGGQVSYTARQSFLFDNKQPRLNFTYQPGFQLKPGSYLVELYCEGYRIGSTRIGIR